MGKFQDFKKKIIEEKEQLISNIKFNSIQEIDNDGDFVDQIQSDNLSEIHNHINSRNRIRLQQLDSALKRLTMGIYGICEDCDDEIPYKRLVFNPCITTCICCAEARELDK